MSWVTTTVTFSGGYDRGPWLAVVRNTMKKHWAIQPYWGDGRGGRRYEPSIPGHKYLTRKEAEAAKRFLGENGGWR